MHRKRKTKKEVKYVYNREKKKVKKIGMKQIICERKEESRKERVR